MEESNVSGGQFCQVRASTAALPLLAKGAAHAAPPRLAFDSDNSAMPRSFTSDYPVAGH
jgi:hypothetical protein